MQGNVTQLFLSLTRLKFVRLGHIKYTEGRKYTGAWSMLTFKKIKLMIGIISLFTLLYFPFSLNMFEYLSIPSHLLAFNNDKTLPIDKIDNYTVFADDDYIIQQNDHFYPQSSGQ